MWDSFCCLMSPWVSSLLLSGRDVHILEVMGIYFGLCMQALFENTFINQPNHRFWADYRAWPENVLDAEVRQQVGLQNGSAPGRPLHQILSERPAYLLSEGDSGALDPGGNLEMYFHVNQSRGSVYY